MFKFKTEEDYNHFMDESYRKWTVWTDLKTTREFRPKFNEDLLVGFSYNSEGAKRLIYAIDNGKSNWEYYKIS